MTEVKELLEERGSNYGDFLTFSNLSQTLYSILVKHHNDLAKRRGDSANLPPFMAESLRMICHKLARIMNGNPFYADSWVDIGGYSALVVEILEESAAAMSAETAKKEAEAAETEAPKEQAKAPNKGTDNVISYKESQNG